MLQDHHSFILSSTPTKAKRKQMVFIGMQRISIGKEQSTILFKYRRIIQCMSSPLILLAEDDFDIAYVLQVYFSGIGFDVHIVTRGLDALEKAKHILPNLIVLDVMLPDIDGYQVCRTLSTNMRTSHIPVIFLTQKDEQNDKLQGLEVGANDYIFKPFDIQELKLRVQGAIRRFERESLTDPRTRLPAGCLIEGKLRRIIQEKGWALLDVRINNFEPFKDVYSFAAGDDILRFTATIIGEIVDELGTLSDFIGHAPSDNFIIITTEDKAPGIRSRLKERFNKEVETHYNVVDRQQRFMQTIEANGVTVKVPLMTISVGMVLSRDNLFNNIREIAELAANASLQDR